jgi:hypothetical protein
LRAVHILSSLIYFRDIEPFRDEECYNTNIPIDEGIKIILSGGIATPYMISEAE